MNYEFDYATARQIFKHIKVVFRKKMIFTKWHVEEEASIK